MSMLTVSGVSVEFATPQGVAHATNDVSFEVRPGRILGIVGETGSGKSVTIRSILGILRPPGRVTTGSILFKGRDLLTLRQRELRSIRGREISLVIQNPFGALNPVLTIGRQFRNVIQVHEKKTSNRECDARAVKALREMRINDPERVLAGYAHELSGGMAQRVVLALALVLEPQLVLADEPTTALDLTTQRAILDLIRDRIVTGERAMILVTHDLGVVAQYCDDVAVMYAGRLVESGTVGDVLLRPRHQYTRALLDSVPGPGIAARGIPGTVPNLIDYPRGCPFAPRCQAATQACVDEMPAATVLPPSRRYACHHPVEAA